MHPDRTVRVGDRVKVKRAAAGYGNLHVGRNGTVKRIDYRTRLSFYGYEPETVYVVQMDAPRPEQITATEVEKVAPVAAATVGDRVRVKRTGRYGLGEVIDGQFGTVEAAMTGRYRVHLDQKPRGAAQRVTVEEVEKVTTAPRFDPPTAEVNDRVTILRGGSTEPAEVAGFVGTVVEIEPPLLVGGMTLSRVYRVKVPGRTDPIAAVKVVKTPTQASEPVAQDEPAAEVVIDIKRAQAAQFAHTLLGNDRLLDDYITLAAYIETGAVPAVSAALVGEVHVMDDPLADWEKELLSGLKLADAKKATDEAVYLHGVAVRRDDSADEDVVEIEGSYINAADVDTLIAFLQNALRVHKAKRSNTPF